MGDPISPSLALIACAIADNDPAVNRRIASEIDDALNGDYQLLEPFTQVWNDVVDFEGHFDSATFLARHPHHREIIARALQDPLDVAPLAWPDYLDQLRKARLKEAVEEHLAALKAVSRNGGDIHGALLKAAEDVERQLKPRAARSNADLLNALVKDLEERAKRAAEGKLTGIATGIMRLDDVLDGFQPGQLTVFGARPSVGKTAFGITILNHVALVERIPSLFIALEGTIQAILRRFAACNTGASAEDLRRGKSQKWCKELTLFIKRFKDAPVRIITHAESPDIFGIERIAAEIRTSVRRDGTRLVVVDYLQKVRAAGQHEAFRLAVGEVSSRLAQIAQSYDIHILTLAQLNRRAEGDNPTIADIAESAQIERDADNILLLDRADRRSEKCRIIVAKQRDGGLDTIDARFDLQRQAIVGVPLDLD